MFNRRIALKMNMPLRVAVFVLIFYVIFAASAQAVVKIVKTGPSSYEVLGGVDSVWRLDGLSGSMANQPQISVVGNPYLIGEGPGQALITAINPEVFPLGAIVTVKNGNLYLGAGTSARGGVASADVNLETGAVLMARFAEYKLQAQEGLVSGAINGPGNIVASSGVKFSVGSIGETNPVNNVQITGKSALTVNGDLHAASLEMTDSYLYAGNIILDKTVALTNNNYLFAKDSIVLGENVSLQNGVNYITANRDITLAEVQQQNGSFNLAAGGVISGTKIVADNIAAGKNISANELEAPNISAGQSISASEITTDKITAGASISGNKIVADTITAGQNITVNEIGAANISAGESISAKEITADKITAGASISGNKIVADTIAAGQNITVNEIGAANISAGQSISASEIMADKITAGASISGNKIVAGTIAAGQNITANELEAVNITAGQSISASEITADNIYAHDLKAQVLQVEGCLTILSSLELADSMTQSVSRDMVLNNARVSWNDLKVQRLFNMSGGYAAGKQFDAHTVMLGSAAGTTFLHVENPVIHNLFVGKNAYAEFGGLQANWLMQLASQVRGQSGVMGVQTSYSVPAGGSLTLNPAAVAATEFIPNQLYFAPQSLVVVNGEAAGENSGGSFRAAAGATAVIAPGARLMITGVRAGQTYRVLGDNLSNVAGAITYQAASAWGEDNLLSDSHLLKPEKAAGRDGYFVMARIPAAIVYPSLDEEIINVIDESITSGVLGTEEKTHYYSDWPGVRFLARAGSVKYMDHDYNLAVTTMESAARIAIVSAVPQMAMAVESAVADAVQGRISLAGVAPYALQDSPGHSFALWATPLFKSVNGFGFQANNYDFDFSGRLGGIVAGFDWTVANAFRFGADLSIGAGYAESGGDLASTSNQMNFWGAGLYGAFFKNNFSIDANINYIASTNAIEQDVPAAMELNNLTGDLTASVLSVGMNVSYSLDLQNWHVIPHAGIDYKYAHVDRYSIYSNGAAIDGKAIDQNLWFFPVGIGIKGDLEAGGWNIVPVFDITALPVAGDVEAKTRVRFTGTFRDAVLHTQTVDYFRVKGLLGVACARENFTLGLNVSAEAGLRSNAQSVFASFSYEF